MLQTSSSKACSLLFICNVITFLKTFQSVRKAIREYHLINNSNSTQSASVKLVTQGHKFRNVGSAPCTEFTDVITTSPRTKLRFPIQADKCIYTSTPQHVFMAWCLAKHRDNFTFTYQPQKFARPSCSWYRRSAEVKWPLVVFLRKVK
jgi:hypothetical protein